MTTTRPPRHRRWLRLAASAAVLVLSAGTGAAPAAQAQGSYEQISGTGSTWSKNALVQWASDVAPNGLRVTYGGSGSTAGRSDFAQYLNDFAVSEIPFGDPGPNGTAGDSSQGRAFAYIPYVAGGTSITYQLQVGGQRVTNLRLSGETLAKIFTNQITDWADPAISADNNGRTLPSLTIRPVVRSDGSGTTAQFTAYLDSQHPGIWQPFNGGPGRTSNFPAQGRMVAASGSDGVMNTVTASSGNGTIGYVEYSYATNASYPVVKLLNKGGYYTEPTDRNVAVALQSARVPAPDFIQDLSGVYVSTDPRAYPMSSYSYLIIPTSSTDRKMNANKAHTLADFISYSICDGQASAGRLGYSPIPLNLVQAGFEQVGKLKEAFPGIDLTGRDAASCNNPTFDRNDPSSNLLARTAPQPAPCDAVGQGPCTTGTGGAEGNPNPPGDTGNAAPDNAAGTTPNGTTGGGVVTDAGATGADPAAAAAAGTGALVDTDGDGVPDSPAAAVDPAAVDPETGLPLASGSSAANALFGTPTELAANRSSGLTSTLGALAAAELVLLLLVPALVARSIARRRTARGPA